MNIFIYNTLYKRKKKFIFNIKKKINIYICGPTVYNKIHIGNLRTFIFFDILRRYLMYNGYKVNYITNITDIGHITNNKDKILNSSYKKKKKPMEIITKYIYNYHFNLYKLNLLPPNMEILASNNIYEQLKIINKLIKLKYTLIKNDSIYLNIYKYIKKYKYGILKKINKKKIKNFCIWKKYKQNILNYKSKWGKGYPGWHTECVSIINKYLGKKIHIHGGGIDLKFPHHENEIVHFNILYNNNPSYFWIHVNSLLLNNKKMSKKNNNFICIEDLIKIKNMNINYENIKFFLLYNNYRKIFNCNINKIKEAIYTYKKIKNLYFILKNNIILYNIKINIIKWIKKCFFYLNNDFNIIKLIKNFLYIRKKIINLNYKINKYNFLIIKYYYKVFINKILGLIIYKKKEKKILNILNNIYIYNKKKKRWYISDKIRKLLNFI
ncbi:MAG: cysteine--tRNA ligase [Candidatus Shikimatogenerans sp. Tduv]|uniref:Cysteine--tRNA ligase n=1 Tax=Candidatus Shikimatogenerans sp. Tduv TaxID=3158567 RepID=A0AAU7QR04_9FLAO